MDPYFIVLLQIFQRLSEEAGNGVEETHDRCMTFLKKFRKHLMKIYNANAAEFDKVRLCPVLRLQCIQ